jgi:biopolymer transport protein ExbD
MRSPLVTPTPINAKINLTPIIDVALVLVIILLITAPLVSAIDMDVSLPLAQTRGAEDEARISITLGKRGEVAVDDKLIAPESLPVLLASELTKKNNNILVVIRADEGTPYETVRRVLSEASAAGAVRLSIATRQKPKGES